MGDDDPCSSDWLLILDLAPPRIAPIVDIVHLGRRHCPRIAATTHHVFQAGPIRMEKPPAGIAPIPAGSMARLQRLPAGNERLTECGMWTCPHSLLCSPSSSVAKHAQLPLSR